MRTLVWFRGKDLRIADHAPLTDAIAGGEVVCVFVLDPYFFAAKRAQQLPHRMQFLLQSLEALKNNIAHKGARLLLVEGKSVEVIPSLCAALRIDKLVAYRWTEPFGRERDARVSQALSIPFVLYEGETLVAPGTVVNQTGGPFQVFSPFARAFEKAYRAPALLPAPKVIPPLPADCEGISSTTLPTCKSLGIAENEHLLLGGERAAHQRLRAFLGTSGASYHLQRDRMDLPGTSRLSQDLKFGTLSIRTAWVNASAQLQGEAKRVFLNELLWREFAHHLLFRSPALLHTPFRADFEGFPYVTDEAGWSAWTEGTTGYPVVDASARQLLQEGFVHNRARMISASFLTKHLLIDYRRGEAHYLKWLTDGDWAQNNAGWQWSAGCGCDAQPYFRVFNPMSQGQKFDPGGDYVRRWVPELARMPNQFIHQPWTAPEPVLRQAQVTLGKTYPFPIVDHAKARGRFLDMAKQHLKRNKAAD
jgi:deoxyribodipyrimidine photo-lyase